MQVIKIPFDDPSVTAYFIVPLEGFEPSQPISVWIPEEGNIGLGGWLEIPKGYKLIKFELVYGK